MDEVVIFVVFGESGEYSDCERWMVRAFRDENKAKELLKNAQQEADSLKIRADNREFCSFEAEGLNKHDPYYRMIYHEVHYDIKEIVLE